MTAPSSIEAMVDAMIPNPVSTPHAMATDLEYIITTKPLDFCACHEFIQLHAHALLTLLRAATKPVAYLVPNKRGYRDLVFKSADADATPLYTLKESQS